MTLLSVGGDRLIVREIGRELPPSRRRRHISLASLIALTIMAVALIATLVVVCFGNTPSRDDTSDRKAGVSYVIHDPIFIEGNTGFTNESGVVWGSGTESDPYMIEGWDINASTANGIEIRNSDVYFIVRDCYVHDGRPNYNIGINLQNCPRAILENNTCVNDEGGICLDHSDSNTLMSNTCSSSNCSGISLFSSSNNVLACNNCSDNGQGIYLTSSNNNALSNNNCSNNREGISLALSSNNFLRSNNCSANNRVGITIGASNNNALNDNNCSYNGDSILIWQSTNNILDHNNCSNSNIGIRLEFAHSNTLSNNTCSNNLYGIRLGKETNYSASNGNTMIWNWLCNNTYYAVSIDKGSSNSIWNNTFCHNNGAGDAYDQSHIQAYDDGNNNWWNSTDGYGNYWNDWTSPDVFPPYGIVDAPYNVLGNAGAKDYYPQTSPVAPIPEFDAMPFVMIALFIGIVLARTRSRKNAV